MQPVADRVPSSFTTPLSSIATAARTQQTATLKTRVIPIAAAHAFPRGTLGQHPNANWWVTYSHAVRLAEVLSVTPPEVQVWVHHDAYEAHRAAVDLEDPYREAYWAWAESALDEHPGVRVSIPDLIGGAEGDNLMFIVDALFRRPDARERLVPIWHPNDSVEQLIEIAEFGFRTIAVGVEPALSQGAAPGRNASTLVDALRKFERAMEAEERPELHWLDDEQHSPPPLAVANLFTPHRYLSQ